MKKNAKSIRKAVGWLIAITGVAGMIVVNYSVGTPLLDIASYAAALVTFGIGLALIVA